MRTISLSAALLLSTAWPVAAQDMSQSPSDSVGDTADQTQTDDSAQPDADANSEDEDNPNHEIIVRASQLAGAVRTDVAPIETINEEDIAAYGASSVNDLLASLSPQTGSGRGRGSGQPVILLNGQRISNFRELRDLPPEAIKQVQIFPEEVALQYGFRPDQRVVNLILKSNFASFVTEAEYGQPQAGGFSTKEAEGTFTRIGKKDRMTIRLGYENSSSLTQAERNLSPTAETLLALGGNITGIAQGSPIDPARLGTATQAAVPIGNANPTIASFLATAGTLNSSDIGAYRTLVPTSNSFDVNGTWSRALSPMTNVSVNASYSLNESTSLLGLAGATITVPSSNPYSPFSQAVTLNRYFTTPRPLTRDSVTHSAQFSSSLNTFVGGFRLTVTGEYGRTFSDSSTYRNVDVTALQAGVSAGTINPFAADFGKDLSFTPPDLSSSLAQNLAVRSNLSGTIFSLPAGDVQATLNAGYTYSSQDSESRRSSIITTSNLSRNVANASANINIPLVERGTGALGGIGNLSINGNFGYNDISDYGGLIEYGGGLNWSPIEGLSFIASVSGDENAPAIGQLANPAVITPNVSTYDFARGETTFVTVTSGGNPLLLSEKIRDLKLGINWQPSFIKDLGIQFEYFRNKSNNTTNAFPLLTPEIEAAFPGRVIRETDTDLTDNIPGRIISIDQRPVNFDEQRSQRIRWGFNFSGNLGKQPQQGGGFGGPGGGGPGRGPGGGGPGGGGPRGPGGGGGGPRAGGGGGGGPGLAMLGGGQIPSRWQIALTHTYRIQDEILIRPGVPVIDLLNGSAISDSGGSPRHEIELSGGLFRKGIGLRLQGTYKTGTHVDGTSLPGSTSLTFSDQTTLGAFLFLDLGMQSFAKKHPFLKGARLTLRVDNILNDVVDVRDQNGVVPLSYQAGLLDPRGRFFELSLRKTF